MLNLITVQSKTERKDNDGNVMTGKSGTPLFDIVWQDADGNTLDKVSPFSVGGGTYYNRNDMTDAEVKAGNANNFTRLMGDSRRDDGTRKLGKLAQSLKAMKRVEQQFSYGHHTEEQAVKVIEAMELQMNAIKAQAFNIASDDDDEEFITL